MAFGIALILVLLTGLPSFGQDAERTSEVREIESSKKIPTKKRRKSIKRTVDAPLQTSWIEKLEEALEPSASIRFGYFSKDRSFSDLEHYLVNFVRFGFRPEPLLGISSNFEITGHGNDLNRRHEYEFDLREGYIEKSIGPFDFRVGRQIVVWGRADKINPTDSLTIKNFTRLTPDDEEQRLGLSTAQLIYNLGSYRFIFVAQPEWRYPVIPIPPLPSGVSIVESVRDETTQQYAFKLDRASGDFDFSISYYDGLDRVPDIRLLSAGVGGVRLAFEHSRIQTLGFDMAFNIGPAALRLEAAGTKTKDDVGTSPLIKNSFSFYSIGFDRNVMENGNINLQYLQRDVSNWSDPRQNPNSLLAQLGVSANSFYSQQLAHQSGYSIRFSKPMFDSKIESEFAFVQWFQLQDYVFRPKITYLYSDSAKVIFGGEIFNGNPDGTFGRFQKFSTAYALVQVNY